MKAKDKPIKKILILNMIAETIGDTILLTPMFNIIKKNFPKSSLAVTVPDVYKDLFSNNPNLDEIIIVKDLEKIGDKDISKTKKLFIYLNIIKNLSRELRKKKFDLCFVTVPNFPLMHLIPYFAGIKKRIGYTYKGSIFSFLLTKKTRWISCHDNPNRHFLESYLDLLRVLDLKIEEKDKVTNKVLTKIKKDKIIAFNAGAKWESKRWNRNNFVILGNYFISKGYKVILLGSPSEYSDNVEIDTLCKGKLIVPRDIKLIEIFEVLKSCKFLIGNDSGLMHMAGAVGTETITVYGSTNPNHSKVLGRNKSHIIFKNKFCKPCISDIKECKYNFKCMEIVKPNDVIKIIKKEI